MTWQAWQDLVLALLIVAGILLIITLIVFRR
jgi:hypothetical protein